MTILRKLSFGALLAATMLSSPSLFAEEQQNLKRIYCAGPSHSSIEQTTMQEIANSLEKAGYITFLPQRDGIQSQQVAEQIQNSGHKETESKLIVAKAEFALEVYQVVSRCDGIVANLMGDQPHDGAISEAAMAWSHKKPVVLYKAEGEKMSALVQGLSGFRVVRDVKNIPKEMYKASQFSKTQQSEIELPMIIQKGGLLWDSMSKIQAESELEKNQQVAELILKIFGKV